MTPLSPWDLARGADRFARELHVDRTAARGAEGLVLVAGSVLTRAAGILVLLSALVVIVPATWSPVVGFLGITLPLLYVSLYHHASTATSRSSFLGSLKHGYRITLLLAVLAAGVLVRFVGLRQGWVDPELVPVPPVLIALLPLLAARVQTTALRRRVQRLAT